MKPYPYSIVLSNAERRIVSLFCFTLSLSWEQWNKLRKDQKIAGCPKANDSQYIALESPRTKVLKSAVEFPFLSQEFAEMLDK